MHGFSSRPKAPKPVDTASASPERAITGLGASTATGWTFRLAQAVGGAPARPGAQAGAAGDDGPAADGGRPLDASTRAYFEPRVGFGLGGVRVHDDPATHRAARSIEARAFAVGEHIGFGAGEYAPGTEAGRRVLAHELAHVGQAYEGRVAGAPRVSQPGEPLEVEADRAARDASRPAWRALAPRPTPAIGTTGMVLRLGIQMSTGNQVTDTAPAATDNLKEDVLNLLDRMHTMWSITNDAYDNQATYIRLLAPGAQVPQTDPTPPPAALSPGSTPPWRFQLTLDAIARTLEPTLAAPVIRRYLGVSVTDAVGRGLANVREDVLTVMVRLNFLQPYPTFSAEQTAVTALPPGSRVADSALTGTFALITIAKGAFASARTAMHPMHADELEYGGADRYAGQTSVVAGDTMMVTQPNETAAVPFVKQFSVFVPRGAVPGRNKVHLFFTPYLLPAQFVAQQGLRASHDGTEWILIGIPGLGEAARPNTVTISTAEIERCLAAAGRGTTIDAIRMSAHSRGHRGLAHTLGMGGASPLINRAVVEAVTVFDASYRDVGAAVRPSALPRMQDPARRGQLAPGAVRLYDVTVSNVSGLTGTQISPALVRGLSFTRIVQDALARGQVTRADLATLPAATLAATNRLMAILPARGTFSTRSPTPAGFTDLNGFLAAQRADLLIVDHATNGLRPFVILHDLYLLGPRPRPPDRDIDAHHWFVTELAHETVE